MRVMTLGGLGSMGAVAPVVTPMHGPYFDAQGSALGMLGLRGIEDMNPRTLALGAAGLGAVAGVVLGYYLAGGKKRR